MELQFMESLLRLEAEAKYFVGATDREYEQSLFEELLKIMEEAESLYGPRDRSYKLLPPRFTECLCAHPFIYPSRKIRIYLMSHSKNRPYVAYQLAHETIHVLGPTRSWATILEEGLATYFADRYVERVYGVQFEAPNPRYDAARRAVAPLIANNKFVIKELRQRQPEISKIDAQLLVDVAGIKLEHAEFLAADFQNYGRKPTQLGEHLAQSAQLFATGFRSIWDQWKSA